MSKKLPTGTGYHWRRDRYTTELVDVRWSQLGPRELVVARFCDDYLRPLVDYEDSEWIGPLENPFKGGASQS